jgi:hypothetical protein
MNTGETVGGEATVPAVSVPLLPAGIHWSVGYLNVTWRENANVIMATATDNIKNKLTAQ